MKRLVGLILVVVLLLASLPVAVNAEGRGRDLVMAARIWRDSIELTVDASDFLSGCPGNALGYWYSYWVYSQAPGEEWVTSLTLMNGGDWLSSPKFSLEGKWFPVNEDQRVRWQVGVTCWWVNPDGRYDYIYSRIDDSTDMAVNLPFRYPKPEPPTQALPSYVGVQVFWQWEPVNGATVWLGWVDGMNKFNPIPGIPPQFTTQGDNEKSGFASFFLQEREARIEAPYAARVQYLDPKGIFQEKTLVFRVYQGRDGLVKVYL